MRAQRRAPEGAVPYSRPGGRGGEYSWGVRMLRHSVPGVKASKMVDYLDLLHTPAAARGLLEP